MVSFRAAARSDADAVATVYLRSRKELVACAPLAHSDAAVREWVRERLLPAGGSTVAVADDRVVGLLAVSQARDAGWIDQLYLLPGWVGQGIGTRLLELARGRLAPPIRLYTFECNRAARRFYERRGFLAISVGDGSRNEEHCPHWPGDEPGGGHGA